MRSPFTYSYVFESHFPFIFSLFSDNCDRRGRSRSLTSRVVPDDEISTKIPTECLLRLPHTDRRRNRVRSHLLLFIGTVIVKGTTWKDSTLNRTVKVLTGVLVNCHLINMTVDDVSQRSTTKCFL